MSKGQARACRAEVKPAPRPCSVRAACRCCDVEPPPQDPGAATPAAAGPCRTSRRTMPIHSFSFKVWPTSTSRLEGLIIFILVTRLRRVGNRRRSAVRTADEGPMLRPGRARAAPRPCFGCATGGRTDR